MSCRLFCQQYASPTVFYFQNMKSAASKIVYLTAGAGGMYCGSCMHDNALAKALAAQGHDIQLVPTYTPIRTDDEDVSVDQVFFGGINVFLQQKVPLLRLVPAFLDRFLDNPWLIRKATSRPIDMKPEALGSLAVSMLKGMKGNQRKEVRRLCKWLAETAKPDVIIFTNALIGGCIPEIKKQTDAKVFVTLQGDDVFLDSLPKKHRDQCVSHITRIAADIDGFITHSAFYRDYMSNYFSIPSEKIHVTKLGLDLADFQAETKQSDSDNITIGYLARLAPEKGLHHLVDAFIALKRQPGSENVQLRIAGWLGSHNEAYADKQFKKLKSAGLEKDFKYIGEVDRDQKIEFLSNIDVLSVPTEFLEPKGLYAIEAMALGTPVVQPAHGCFPEMIESTGGGLLFQAGDIDDLQQKILQMVQNRDHRIALGKRGRKSIRENRSSEQMATELSALISRSI